MSRQRQILGQAGTPTYDSYPLPKIWQICENQRIPANVREHPRTGVRECPRTPAYVRVCPRMSANVRDGPRMSANTPRTPANTREPPRTIFHECMCFACSCAGGPVSEPTHAIRPHTGMEWLIWGHLARNVRQLALVGHDADSTSRESRPPTPSMRKGAVRHMFSKLIGWVARGGWAGDGFSACGLLVDVGVADVGRKLRQRGG